MKLNELIEVSTYLQTFSKIHSISRVDDTIIKIVFLPHKRTQKSQALFFDLTKGDSHIFIRENFKRAKLYNAPFDVILNKRFANSHINKVEVLEGNRILRFYTSANVSYKSLVSILQFEFTGRNTNCIILDENEFVLEALRHIDLSVSSRSVKVGEVLEPLEAREFIEKPSNVGEDVVFFLEQEYERRANLRLLALKNQKLINVAKRIDKLQSKLDALEKEEELLEKADLYNLWGTLVLSNIYKIKDYQKDVHLVDFEGNEVHVLFPKEAKTPTHGANLLFSESKKLKRKAKSLYIERDNLQSKVDFLRKLQHVIEKSNDETELGIIMPKQKQSKKERNDQRNYEVFFLDGFKIMLGKNEKGNITLLKEAKKSDIWLHIKDIPSSHVIIRTDKQNIPQHVIDFAAKICVEFSVTKKGLYLVDYTQRRNVKVGEGANVTYVDYKTLYFEE